MSKLFTTRLTCLIINQNQVNLIQKRWKRTVEVIEINNYCKALVPYGTNINSTVGLKLTQEARNLMRLTEYTRRVFIGLLLGDGSFKTNKSKTVAYFKYNQAVIRAGYVLHLFEILSHYCTHLPNYHVRKYDTGYLQLYSRSLPALLELYELFYKDGIKIIPRARGRPLALGARVAPAGLHLLNNY